MVDTLSLRHPLTLDELLNYRLVQLVGFSGAPVVRLLEGQYGIARREWRLLAAMACFGPTSPSELANKLQLDRPRTSRAIGSLVSKGLVRRHHLSSDRRCAVVELTTAGKALHEEIFPQVAAFNTRILEVLDGPTAGALDLALRQLAEQARRVNLEAFTQVHAQRRIGGARRPPNGRDAKPDAA
jgi:DNA-binding MarR family transcriptional regulator